ncbi:MAG: hypothetical protein ACFBSF_05170 [Leptolyngbyaceae cyanobacterium]
MLVSNFELLVKPIAPASTVPVGGQQVARKVVQAYFLTISNLNPNGAVSLDVDFIAFTPALTNEVITFFDVAGTDDPSGLVSVSNQRKRRTVTIPADDTGLLLLQPDLKQPNVLNNADLEVRGYVEISVSQLSPTPNARLLVTPQSRGTFIPENAPGNVADLDFDQIAYNLPLAEGRALLTL